MGKKTGRKITKVKKKKTKKSPKHSVVLKKITRTSIPRRNLSSVLKKRSKRKKAQKEFARQVVRKRKSIKEILGTIQDRQELSRAERLQKEEEKKSRMARRLKDEGKSGIKGDEFADLIKQEAALEGGGDRRKKKREAEEESEDNDAVGADYTLDRTPMKIYLQQIEDIPLLTPEEEILLGEKIYSKHKGAPEARHQMIQSNLRLVIAIAKRYANMGLPFSDLVEEGNIGLMRAVEKFNPRRGYRFSTYASWWIKQSIMRSLSNQGKTIRIPVYLYDVIAKWRRVRDGLMQKLNRMPTRKEIAEYMKVPVLKVREIENIVGKPSSLNTPVSLDGAAELIDLIEDDTAHAPDEQLAVVLRNDRIKNILEKLDERENRILTLRFGLNNEEMHTLEETAQQFNITRERVRQIEAAAIKKVRVQLALENDSLENYLPSRK